MKKLIVSSLALTALGAFAAVPGVETFDTDTAGFVQATTSSVVVHAGAGGNPDGHILVRKDLSPPVFDIGALTTQPDFTGNFAADGIGGVCVDLNFGTDNVTDAWIRFRPSNFENGWRFPLAGPFDNTGSWDSYSVSFNPTWTDLEARAAGWVTDHDVDPAVDVSPTFADVMDSVHSSEVRFASSGSTLVGIDNFQLKSMRVPDSSAAGVAIAALGSLMFLSRRVRR